MLSLDQLKHKRFIRANEFRTNCPLCGDTKEHLYVNVDHRVYFCFKCGAKGKVRGDVEFRTPTTETHIPLADPTAEGIAYLKQRGLTLEEIMVFNPKSSPRYPLYVFSLYSNVAIVGRAIVEAEPKYRIFQSTGSRLWGIEHIDYSKELIVVEGLFDLFGVRRSFTNVIAMLGKTVSPTVLSFLQSYPKDIYLCLDTDAQKEQQQLYQGLCFFRKNVFRIFLRTGDPWDARDSVNFGELVTRKEDIRI
jgi:hypothetical protein